MSSICLLSSSFTAHFAVSALRKAKVSACAAWLGATIFLGGIFIASTANEWYHLIYEKGLTIKTNLFGTTFYSLVGLHATHVVVGLCMLTIALIAALRGKATRTPCGEARGAVAVLALCRRGVGDCVRGGLCIGSLKL